VPAPAPPAAARGARSKEPTLFPIHPKLRRVHAAFRQALTLVEYFGLLTIALATTYAMVEEVGLMIAARGVTLADLLLMFLYLEVLAMIGQYFSSGQLPVRFPLYIAMVAMARYIILDVKELSEFRMLAVSTAILLLTLAVLIIRYGHIKFPYRETEDYTPLGKDDKPGGH
jgi:protein PsiE